MNVLSLFDGLSIGHLALNNLDIPINKYYSSEIDKTVINITQYNFPDTIQLGDITNWRNWDIDFSKIDLLLASPPCPSWSNAGLKKGIDDPRGKLVFDLIDIWSHIKKLNPNVKHLFENVKMKKEFQDYLNNLFGHKPTLLDSSLVSAQSRKRLYWQNIVDDIKQPIDKGIILRDILEFNVSPDYVLKKDKSNKLLKLASISNKDRKDRVNNNKPLDDIEYNVTLGNSIQDNHLKQNGVITKAKSGTLTCSDIPCVIGNKLNFVGGIENGRRLHDGKNNSRNFGEGYRIYSSNGKSATLTANSKGGLCGHTGLYTEKDFRVRKLTPIECERLQTMPDNFSNPNGKISNSTRYKVIGNAWTVKIIEHILSGLKTNKGSIKTIIFKW